LEVPLEEDGVSRRHAQVVVSAGKVEVKDLGSTNGTYVNGERTPGALLREGDRVTVARSTMVLVPDPVS
jgi:pSer/pThr/pTyr-binding forkhead associated (FHA) protein